MSRFYDDVGIGRALTLAAAIALGLLAGCSTKSEGNEGNEGEASGGEEDDGEEAPGEEDAGEDDPFGDEGNDGPADGTGNASADDAPADDGGSDAAEDDGMSFIGMPDGGIEGQCDPAAQDCPEGQKCTSYVTTPGGATVDATHCVEILGDALYGEECERFTDNDTCAPGFFCMTGTSGDTGMGFCLEYCEVGQPCEFGGECFAFNDGALPVCETTCDPLASDCPDGQGCYAAFDNFVCARPGVDDGSGNDGDTCATIQGCQPGLICRGGTEGCSSESGCCTPLCEVGGEAVCTGAEMCIQALEDPGPGLDTVGYCGIPE